MQSRVAVVLASTLVVASCSRTPQGFDTIKSLHVEEVGEVPLSLVEKPPPRVGEITWFRTEKLNGVIAAVHTQAPCPRMIHSTAGAEPQKDKIELCYSYTPSDEGFPGWRCSTDVYVRYEILGVPKDVEPKFEFKGDCFKK
jgi:hypothetical protein